MIDRSMDWGNVTAEDLIDALREVDWSSPPRPLLNSSPDSLFPNLTPNGTTASNAIFTRLGFLMRPVAIVAAALTTISIAFLNDRPVIRGLPSAKRAIHIYGQPRWVFVVEKL